MDHACDLALAGAGLAGQKHAHVERCDERRLREQRRECRAAADHAFAEQALADVERRIVRVTVPADEAVGERGEAPCEELDSRAIALGERPGARVSLKIERAEWRSALDRCAQHGLDVADAHAAAISEARVEQRRRRGDRGARGQRLGDDSRRDGPADALQVVRGESVRGEPAHGARTGRVELQLEVREPRADRLDDQCQRVAQERVDLGVRPELQEPKVEVALGPYFFVVVESVVVHGAD